MSDSIGYNGFSKSRINIEVDKGSNFLIGIRKEVRRNVAPESYDDDYVDYFYFFIKKDGREVFVYNHIDDSYFLSLGRGYLHERRGYTRDVKKYLFDLIVSKLIGFIVFGEKWAVLENVIYLPAARTGVSVALDYYVDGLLSGNSSSPVDRVEREGRKLNLPAPIADFAGKLARSRMRRSGLSRFFYKGVSLGKRSSLSKLIKGKLSIGGNASLGTFLYTPTGSELELPLVATSSLVTELASLGFIQGSLRTARRAFLIFEEPEAHLHLSAQREMARYLAEFVNEGNMLLITTHSDTFIQQINNLICVSDHPKKDELKKEFNISDDEAIRRENVAAYDFVCKDSVTLPEKLQLTPTGFVAESLNEVLRDLANETYKIISTLDEDI